MMGQDSEVMEIAPPIVGNGRPEAGKIPALYFHSVLLIMYNPDTTRRVFAEIKRQRPSVLYLFSDGAKTGDSENEERCRRVRSLADEIDWECDVHRMFLDVNYGPGKGVGTAISWFFSEVEEGIVFEHDALPHPDYFAFCAEMLERYRDDSRIGLILGQFYEEKPCTSDSYFFSRYRSCGYSFASWRRVMKNYDLYLDAYSLSDLKRAMADMGFLSWGERQYAIDHFLLQKKQKADTWDWQMSIMSWCYGYMNIVPNVCLIKNIGFNVNSTNYKYGNIDSKIMNAGLGSILPLRHPEKAEYDPVCDSVRGQYVNIVLPILHKPVKIRKGLAWAIWRWFRRNFVAKRKFGR